MSVKTINPRRVKNIKLEYITDIKGKKTKVVMQIDEYENLLEDLHDLSVIAARKKENLLTFDNVLNGLKMDGGI